MTLSEQHRGAVQVTAAVLFILGVLFMPGCEAKRPIHTQIIEVPNDG